MAHKDVGTPKSYALHSANQSFGRFDSGVVLCKYDRELEHGQSPYMKNMIYDKNMLRTRFGQMIVQSDVMPSGKLHSYNSEVFFGRYLFHTGSCLYSFDGNDIQLLYDSMPDCDSFVFEMNSVLYIFCRDVRIFTVTKDFEVSEQVITDTKVAENAKWNMSEYTETDVPDNMIMFRVSVDYQNKDNGAEYYILPTECDPSYQVIFTKIDGGIRVEPEYTVNGNRIELASEQYVRMNISYVPAKGTKYRNFDKIFGCRYTCTYGGNSQGGTRVFFSGNDEYPGYYFYSELLSPLCVRTLSYDILGNGSEKVTCLAKQKSELVVFCENSIYRINYTFDGQNGVNFVTSGISNGIGCDIPHSVKLIDNRLVFAKSGLGIYIIVSSEYTDELNIRRISGNINGNSGEGFLFEDAEELKESVSSDSDGRYMLVCPSGNAYVWDYGGSPYVAYDSPLSSEKKLSWYVFDSIYECALFQVETVLFGIRKTKDGIEFVRFCDGEGDFGEDILCMYKSREFDVGDEFSEKTALKLNIGAVGTNGTVVLTTVYADGVPIMYETYTFDERPEDGEKQRYITYSVPGYSAHRFSVLFVCLKGRAGFYGGSMEFSLSGR